MTLLKKINKQLCALFHYMYTQIGEGNGNPLQYSCLENSMDGGVWYAAVHGVARSRTRSRSDFTFTFHFHALEKEIATHSSILAWRIPGTEERGGLPSMGSHKVGHNWSDLAAAAAAAAASAAAFPSSWEVRSLGCVCVFNLDQGSSRIWDSCHRLG